MKNISVEQVDLIASRLLQDINPVCIVALAQRLLSHCGLRASMNTIQSDDVFYTVYHNEYVNTSIQALCSLSTNYPDQDQDYATVLAAIESASRAARSAAVDAETRVMERMRNSHVVSPAVHEHIGSAPTTEELFEITSRADCTAEGPIA